ncbi:hypothetical protein [Nitrosospira briensis]|uniref:Uncharacterized protein n=1 Tax=Nitrosospira briensis TaxID=35799 RepID=A0A1I4YF43_9PROT|nr:hypothetical protein [Nitrosospira briensis]SFN36612.1 hypothetical protein SAMN05216386_0667 [Nitrosospira briensis]SFN72809.1 hypothetical protein SAMN05216332_101386 [Nitrosospira briensis]HEU4855646.1 hypothetical protein [Nitrosospira sp.]
MDKLSPDDAFELGNQFREAAIALGDWRLRNRAGLSKAQWEELDDQEIALLNTASGIFTSAIGAILTDSQPALAGLKSSVKSAKSAIKHITGFKEALDLASALLLLAGAVYSGNAAIIPAGIVALQDAAEAILASDEPDA